MAQSHAATHMETWVWTCSFSPEDQPPGCKARKAVMTPVLHPCDERCWAQQTVLAFLISLTGKHKLRSWAALLTATLETWARQRASRGLTIRSALCFAKTTLRMTFFSKKRKWDQNKGLRWKAFFNPASSLQLNTEEPRMAAQTMELLLSCQNPPDKHNPLSRGLRCFVWQENTDPEQKPS